MYKNIVKKNFINATFLKTRDFIKKKKNILTEEQ